MPDDPVLIAQDVHKVYRRGQQSVTALSDVTIAFGRGEFVSIVGPSGSGKSTLLQLLGGIDVPTSGSVRIDGQDLADMSDDALTAFRRRRLGFVFQFFHLIPTMSAWENVALPHLLDGRSLRSGRKQAAELLERVGLGHRMEHRPAELSGGEMQRVAIARALSADPVLVLADEPTGNLDTANGNEILSLLLSLASDGDRTVVMVTHDRGASARGTRTVEMLDGQVASDVVNARRKKTTPR